MELREATPLMPRLSLILPTYNERENLAPIVRRIGAALNGIREERLHRSSKLSHRVILQYLLQVIRLYAQRAMSLLRSRWPVSGGEVSLSRPIERVVPLRTSSRVGKETRG